jgi:hypothetical protein
MVLYSIASELPLILRIGTRKKTMIVPLLITPKPYGLTKMIFPHTSDEDLHITKRVILIVLLRITPVS